MRLAVWYSKKKLPVFSSNWGCEFYFLFFDIPFPPLNLLFSFSISCFSFFTSPAIFRCFCLWFSISCSIPLIVYTWSIYPWNRIGTRYINQSQTITFTSSFNKNLVQWQNSILFRQSFKLFNRLVKVSQLEFNVLEWKKSYFVSLFIGSSNRW